MDALDEQSRLIDRVVAMLDTDGSGIMQFETHASRVLVGGGSAYKFKKALRLPFLDFSTLAARRRCCEEECRLNRRLAPDLYLGVTAVTGDPARPGIDGTGPRLEYAVRMRAFSQQDLWTCRIAQGLLGDAEVDSLALLLARFHQDAARAPACTGWGTVHTVRCGVKATLDELGRLAPDASARATLTGLGNWERQCGAEIGAMLVRRKGEGRIREGHGDLHCDNLLTESGRVQAFDCIEFSAPLRWIDVMDDLAFIYMDLAFRGRPGLAARLLNRYLEASGDYGGLAVLRYYRVHRALVRAKVMLLRSVQPGTAQTTGRDCSSVGLAYLDFARRCALPGKAALVITHGCSGSGKTTLSRLLVESLGAVQLRSDVERKRMHGLPADARITPQFAAQLYGDAATHALYSRLVELARMVAGAGWPVVVDAACLRIWQRSGFRELAASLAIPFFIVDVRAPPAVMARRIAARQRQGTDASDANTAVLACQLSADEALTEEERGLAIRVRGGDVLGSAHARIVCRSVLAAVGCQRQQSGRGEKHDSSGAL